MTTELAPSFQDLTLIPLGTSWVLALHKHSKRWGEAVQRLLLVLAVP